MDIKIMPKPLKGTIEAISSKSYAHRAFICAALSKNKSNIKLNSSSVDIDTTIDCLNKMGADIYKEKDKEKDKDKEKENYVINPISTLKTDLIKINCMESGSTLRFIIPVIGALGLNVSIEAEGRLPFRPNTPYYRELPKKGIKFSKEGTFPLEISGQLMSGLYRIEGNISSQFITGLILALGSIKAKSLINITSPLESKPYVDITLEVLKHYGIKVEELNKKELNREELNREEINREEYASYRILGGSYLGKDYIVEGDWSNSAFWLCAGVKVSGLNLRSKQGDRNLLYILEDLGYIIHKDDLDMVSISLENKDINLKEKEKIIDATDIPDLIPILSVVAATLEGTTTKVINAERLKLKESDRLESTTQMLKNLGANIIKNENGLTIIGVTSLEGGVVESYNDHRIAMSAAIAAIKCKGPVIIKDALAINKSYPNFFNDYKLLGGNIDVL